MSYNPARARAWLANYDRIEAGPAIVEALTSTSIPRRIAGASMIYDLALAEWNRLSSDLWYADHALYVSLSDMHKGEMELINSERIWSHQAA